MRCPRSERGDRNVFDLHTHPSPDSELFSWGNLKKAHAKLSHQLKYL